MEYPNVLDNFFVLEGVDGVGKSSVLSALEKKCEEEGVNAWFTREPTPDFMGAVEPLLRQNNISLNNHMLSYLFAADRFDHCYKDGGIVDKHTQGFKVFCDRYRFSSTAYQSFLGSSSYNIGCCPARGHLVWKLNEMFPWPRKLFFLDAPIETIQERLLERDGCAGDKEKLEQLQRAYRAHMDYLSHAAPRRMEIIPVGTTISIDEIASEIFFESLRS